MARRLVASISGLIGARRTHQRRAGVTMAVVVFTDRDGQQWNVWRVQPTSSTAGLQERFQNGWLCFESADGASRARLPLEDVPAGWEALPDERLELLCRLAEVASRPRGTTPTEAHEAQEGDEDHARGRKTGPRAAAGRDRRK
jgi:hypothetical protein